MRRAGGGRVNTCDVLMIPSRDARSGVLMDMDEEVS
jgi:hypothetical protein